MREIGYFWKNVDNQLPAEAGLVQQHLNPNHAAQLTPLADGRWPSHPLWGITRARPSKSFVHSRDNIAKIMLSLGITLSDG
jgi:hypothetical protein